MAHHIDIAVGNHLRQIRRIRKISQAALGEVVDLTFQQIQKYGRGASRISASKLWLLAQELGVTVSYFFEGLEGAEATDAPVFSDAALELAALFDANSRVDVQKQMPQLFRAVNTVEDGSL